jgi:hypothetical protein
MHTTHYEQDYFQWLLDQATLLREGSLHLLDREHLVEEIEDLGKSERRALESDLVVVLMHLLKWVYQPKRRGNSWKYSILEHRRRIQKRLRESPSLKLFLAEIFDDTYQDARVAAAKETELDLEIFSENSLFSLSEAMDEQFLPD